MDKPAACRIVEVVTGATVSGLAFPPERHSQITNLADVVISEMAPSYDDLSDSATQALRHLRTVGMAQTDEEENFTNLDRVTHRGRVRPLYPGFA